MKRVLVVSKPVCPPWSDSSKNLVRDLARCSERTEFSLITTRGHAPPWPRVHWEPIHRHAGRHAPGLGENMRTMLRLLRPDAEVGLHHFFFAPNPRTCSILAPIVKLKGKPSIHTICSQPRTFDGIASLLFADRVVALSHATARKLKDAGVRGVVEIPPGIDASALAPPKDDALARTLGLAGQPVVLYAGDHEMGGTDALLDAWPAVLARVPTARLVLACRIKTEGGREDEARARRRSAEGVMAGTVTFLQEVADMASLLDLATVVALPVRTLYRKMDVPLVLLEAMSFGKPVVTSDLEPLVETVSAGGGLSVPVDDAAALAATLAGLLEDGERRSALGEEGRLAVQSKWSAAAMARRYEALYDELMGPGHS